jgi:hypothetical protein
MLLYRAVGDKEFFSIMSTSKFSCLPGGVGVKYFGKNYEETLKFADLIINRNIVAVVEVSIPCGVVRNVGDFINVDPFLFKHGTVEIWEDNLDVFNNAIHSIVHIF